MRRFLILSALALLLAAPASAWTAMPASGDAITSVSPSQPVAYQAFTTTGTALIAAESCHTARVRILPSTLAAATGAVSATVWDCMRGTGALDAAGKRGCHQLYTRAGSALDGISSTGTDGIYGTTPVVVGVEVTTHPGGTPAQNVVAEIRCE